MFCTFHVWAFLTRHYIVWGIVAGCTVAYNNVHPIHLNFDIYKCYCLIGNHNLFPYSYNTIVHNKMYFLPCLHTVEEDATKSPKVQHLQPSQ